MAKTEYNFTAAQIPLGDTGKLDYSSQWAVWFEGEPVRSEGRYGTLITFPDKESAEANFAWAQGAIERGDSLTAERTQRARAADEARGIKPPAPPVNIPKGAKVAGRA